MARFLEPPECVKCARRLEVGRDVSTLRLGEECWFCRTGTPAPESATQMFYRLQRLERLKQWRAQLKERYG